MFQLILSPIVCAHSSLSDTISEQNRIMPKFATVSLPVSYKARVLRGHTDTIQSPRGIVEGGDRMSIVGLDNLRAMEKK